MFKSSSLTNYAPIQNPTFTGKVTLPDGSSITKTTSSYLKQSDAVNTYATKSSVTSVEIHYMILFITSIILMHQKKTQHLLEQ